MKNIITSFLFITFLLSACTPAEIPPTPTPIPPTVTLPPTTTPLPTATVTATAVPTVEEKGFRSCVDPELITQVDADFTAKTGIVLDNPSDSKSLEFASFVKKFSYWGDTNREYIHAIPFVKTGFPKVSIDSVPGIAEVACLYGRSNLFERGTFSFAVGWVDMLGSYHPFSRAFEGPPGGKDPIIHDSQEQLDWLENLPDGAKVDSMIITYDGLLTINDYRSDQDWNDQNTRNIISFIKAMNNQLLQRMGGGGNGRLEDLWKLMRQDLKDVGFLPGGSWQVSGYFEY